jgi:hypothetical protein
MFETVSGRTYRVRTDEANLTAKFAATGGLDRAGWEHACLGVSRKPLARRDGRTFSGWTMRGQKPPRPETPQ